MEFRLITLQNLDEIAGLSVEANQQPDIAPNLYCVAQAGLKASAIARAVYIQDKAVGFFSVIDDSSDRNLYIWNFMVDRDQQRKGIGRRMLSKLIEEFFDPKNNDFVEILLKRIDSPSHTFWKSQGFIDTGQIVAGAHQLLLNYADQKRSEQDVAPQSTTRSESKSE